MTTDEKEIRRKLRILEHARDSGDATPTLLIEDGRFLFVNSDGDRQEFVAG